uniref:Uncharacterized protein n=1 Tax=Anguilla anguilla TaxID=7936 RepID=A0A0E9SH63_ANGAN
MINESVRHLKSSTRYLAKRYPETRRQSKHCDEIIHSLITLICLTICGLLSLLLPLFTR